MKGKKLLAGMLSAAMVLGTMAMPAFADDSNTQTPDWDSNPDATVVAYGIGENNSNVYTKTLVEALNAVYKSNPEQTVTIDCKNGKNVGDLGHAHIADSIIINGNGAYVNGGDLEIDLYSYSRSVGIYAPKDDPNSYIHNPNESDLSKDITLTVNDLNKLHVWGSRRTSHNVDIVLNNCKNMKSVYITRYGDEPMLDGKTNISLNGCTFDSAEGSGNESVFSNYAGEISIKDCAFTGIIEPIKINNKSDGSQKITIENSSFKNCALASQKTESYQEWCAPIGVMTTGEYATTVLNVNDCTFEYGSETTPAGNGDIRLGTKEDKIITPNVTLNISGTAAEVQVQEPSKTSAETKKVKANETATVEMTAVAAINGVKYATLKDAIKAAQDGDTINILTNITLNGDEFASLNGSTKSLTFTSSDKAELIFNNKNFALHNNSTITFKNLTLTWDNSIYRGFQHSKNMVYDNCKINGLAFLYGETETFTDCEFVQTDADAYNVWTYGAGVATFNNCKFRCNGKSVLVYVESGDGKAVNVDNCEFYAENPIDGKAAVEIHNEWATSKVKINNSSAIGFGGGSISGDALYNVTQIKAGGTTELTVNGKAVDLSKVPAPGAPTPSETKPVLKIAFVKNDAASDETSHVYDIKVVSDSDINKLNTAELTFDFATDKANEYTITPAENVVLTGDNANANRYMFSFKNGEVRETAKEITIGQATVTGYGKYTLKVNGTAVSVVNATTLAANLVDTYASDGSADGKLDVANSTTDVNGEKQEIKIPTKKLTINITFPNAVNSNRADYQQMKATITGGDYSEEFALGEMTNGAYKIEKELTENTPYTVTVSGAGYRTARYTVTLNADKTLNFWNNVMDNAIEVEVGNQSYKKDVTFLAGDIVKDGIINIYDLSAVVSYFGADNLVTDHPEYAKYDLNRDGKIDSKDVAYVLVSWGK